MTVCQRKKSGTDTALQDEEESSRCCRVDFHIATQTHSSLGDCAAIVDEHMTPLRGLENQLPDFLLLIAGPGYGVRAKRLDIRVETTKASPTIRMTGYLNDQNEGEVDRFHQHSAGHALNICTLEGPGGSEL